MSARYCWAAATPVAMARAAAVIINFVVMLFIFLPSFLGFSAADGWIEAGAVPNAPPVISTRKLLIPRTRYSPRRPRRRGLQTDRFIWMNRSVHAGGLPCLLHS